MKNPGNYYKKKCPKCGMTKNIVEFQQNKSGRDIGYHAYQCKKCAGKYQVVYIKALWIKKPWLKHFEFARARCKYRRGNKTYWDKPFSLTREEIRELWFRDEGWLLKEPSIDRVDNDKGYCKDNCRFIEFYKNRQLGSAKLNWPQVRIIRRLLTFGTLSYREIGDFFGVTRENIYSIRHRETWRDDEEHRAVLQTA
jgi:hypothetical protein